MKIVFEKEDLERLVKEECEDISTALCLSGHFDVRFSFLSYEKTATAEFVLAETPKGE